MIEQLMPNGFRRIVAFRPAYDKRAEGYGIHNMEIVFVLIGPMGAVDFVIHKTEWFVASAREHLRKLPMVEELDAPSRSSHPWRCSINYHSKVAPSEGQSSIANCQWLDGKECFCGGTHLADGLMERFVAEGEEVVWKELEEWYESRLAHSFQPEI